jgi:hypothetical protein
MPSDSQWLAYRETFRSRYGEEFQLWFETLVSALHPVGDFQKIAKTSGDGGLDGYVINSHLVYQVYAPRTDQQRSDGAIADKIKRDFGKAYATLHGNLRYWVFVYNSALGKLSIDVLAK